MAESQIEIASLERDKPAISPSEDTMPRNISSIQKIDAFLTKLRTYYNVRKLKDRPQIYQVNDSRINVRCKSKNAVDSYGNHRFFYDISIAVLPEVEFVAYLMITPEHFFLIPSARLKDWLPMMYPNNRNDGVGTFTINWDRKIIELKGKKFFIDEFLHDMSDKSYAPSL